MTTITMNAYMPLLVTYWFITIKRIAYLLGFNFLLTPVFMRQNDTSTAYTGTTSGITLWPLMGEPCMLQNIFSKKKNIGLKVLIYFGFLEISRRSDLYLQHTYYLVGVINLLAEFQLDSCPLFLARLVQYN